MNTKRIILGLILVSIISTNMYFVFRANSRETVKLATILTNIEAFADNGEFTTDPWGTNWEEYTTDCTYSKTSGTSVTIGIPGSGVTVSDSQTATWTEYGKKVCGYGTGTCLAAAGC